MAALSVFVTTISFSQTVIWSETFDPAPGWTTTPIGPNGADPNYFEEDDDEGGVAPPGCGIAGNGNNTLHITSVFFPGGGAAYDAGGLCGVLFCPQTATRAESPNISTVGQTNLTVEFDYIHGGDANDYGGLWYNDGGGWVALVDPLPQTPGGCLPQGQWTNYTIALPASCENIPNLQIGFSWVNNDDGVGTDPSIAINNVQITTPAVGGPPTADFTASLTTICEGDCIDFTDMSTLGTNPTWAWTFNGAATGTSNIQNPTNICYPTAGTYDVELVVTDDNGNDTELKVGYITVNAPPNAGTSTAQNLCNNATLDLNTLIPGADPGTWVETSGTPSGQFNAGTGVLDGNGLPIGNVYTFDYTVTGTPPCSDATTTMTITIIDCSGGGPPTAAFTASQTVICEGDCIDFTDMSTLGTNPTWSWTFTGAATATSNVQNPTNICYLTAGNYQVELTVTDDNGADTETQVAYITVNPRPFVTATAAPNDTVCAGDQVTLTGGGAVNYTWDNGVTDNTPFTPTIGSTTYTVTGTDANGCTGQNAVTVVVENCDPLVANWGVASSTICQGDCITFTDSTTGPVNYWNWTFGNGANPATSSLPNPTVCFDSTGVINVDLEVAGAGDTSVFSGTITVFAPPTVTAGNDTLIDLGGAADLWATGSGPGTWLWTPGGNVACDTCAVTTASPFLNTLYIVQLTDINGCNGYDTVDVQVNFIEGIDVPSAFSPNGDNHNDILFVKGIGIETMTFSVYNRYGERVFVSDNQNIGWDGTFRGRDENSGVFTWMLEYKLVNGSVGVLKGNTTLIR